MAVFFTHKFIGSSSANGETRIAPDDVIENRDLHDVENSWFYLVFLQSVIRFLLIKQYSAQLDTTFYRARDSLLHYGNWMMDHEYPFLDKPEILEYPNVTWVAQDLRKAHIFWWAAHFSLKNRENYLKRSEFFREYVEKTLPTQKGYSHARILSILMQNPLLRTDPEMPRKLDDQCSQLAAYPVDPERSFLTEIWNSLRNLSFRRELAWLTRRSHAISKLVSRFDRK